jgi:hypothetical protein
MSGLQKLPESEDYKIGVGNEGLLKQQIDWQERGRRFGNEAILES